MKALSKRPSKQEKERQVLLGLVELYIASGQPIGSQTLKEHGFSSLSSATIRNYFVSLEKQGYLVQHHASGGRTPTDLAFRLYAHNNKDTKKIHQEDAFFLSSVLDVEDSRDISTYLQRAVEALSEITSCACFLLSPRFDHDFITSIKLLHLDKHRYLCVLISDFGLIQTEVLYNPRKLSTHSLKKIEESFGRLLRHEPLDDLSTEETLFAKQAYNEAILRHIINYANFTKEEVYKSGFAKLLQHPEFNDAKALASNLSLFENVGLMHTLLKDCYENNKLKFWVGSDLEHYTPKPHLSSLVAIPYMIKGKVVGAVGVLGPMRMPYTKVFGLLDIFQKLIGEHISKTMDHHHITYRLPFNHPSTSDGKDAIASNKQLLIENQSEEQHG